MTATRLGSLSRRNSVTTLVWMSRKLFRKIKISTVKLRRVPISSAEIMRCQFNHREVMTLQAECISPARVEEVKGAPIPELSSHKSVIGSHLRARN